MSASQKVAVVGGSGFVGTAVCGALAARGARVSYVQAPRLSTSARDVRGLVGDLESIVPHPESRRLAGALIGHDAVVNAAGVAQATGRNGDTLFGANALLPGLIAELAPSGSRYVHVSSAAVQGRKRILDASPQISPFSPYSSSKALGELLVTRVRESSVIYRPTSVHGKGRPVTASLLRFLASHLASVASGERPTPQILVENVGDAVAFLAMCEECPPRIVLHPWEGLTASGLYEVLGGRRPVVIPVRAAQAFVSLGHVLAPSKGGGRGAVRRLEMLWLGQAQERSWLEGRWTAPLGRTAWRSLRE